MSAPGAAEINSAGLHGFFLVNDVSRSREILETLQARAWTEGLAWIALSKSGAQLVRSVVDISVGSPERLIFEAPPILETPVRRQARKPVMREGYALTAPQLTPVQTVQAQEAERAARHEISPQAAEAETAYIEGRAQDDAKRTGRPLEEARQHVRRMLQGTVLADDHLLQLKDGSYLTVAEILDSPDLWDRQSIPDPVEGLAYGRDKATLLLKPRPGKASDKPVLLSHAHGVRTRYTFARYEAPQKERPRKEDIAPFYPAPAGDREEQIDAHEATCRAWGYRAIPAMQAIAWVRQRYAELDTEATDHKAQQRKIRKDAQRRFGLDFLPAARVTKSTPLPRFMLTGAQGVGKTTALVGPNGGTPQPGVLHEMRGLVPLMLLPDHGMASEAARRYHANAPDDAPPHIAIRGRGAPDPTAQGEKMCRIPDIARRIVENGESVKSALCGQCPFKEICGYLAQEARVRRLAEDPAGLVIFAPHEYAQFPLPANVRPDAVVYDERPRDMGVEDVTLSFDALTETLPFEGGEAAVGRFAETSEKADAAQAQLQFIRPLRIALRDAAQNAPDRIMDYLRHRAQQPVDRNMIEGAISGLSYFESKATGRVVRQVMQEASFAELGGKPFNVEDRLEREIAKLVPKVTRQLRTVFKALLQEIDGTHEASAGIVASRVPVRRGSRELVQGVRAVLIREQRHVDGVPFLHLDGTGDADMSRLIFGELDHYHHPVERNARITQVTGADFSKTYITGVDANGKPWTGDWRRKSQTLRADLIAAISRLPDVAVFSNKTVRKALGLENDPLAGHFGALRGRNDWENYSTGIVIGREQPAPWDVERIARAYAAKAGDTFTPARRYSDSARGVRGYDGTADVFEVKAHPDPWVDRVLRQIREKEVEQAIDRLRLIHNKTPKEIYLLSPVVIDCTVDRVMSWQDFRQGGTRVERALKVHGVLPLNGQECAALLPSIWNNERTARRDLVDRGLNRTFGNKRILFTECPAKELTVCSYVTPVKQGQRRTERAAVVAGPPDKARELLEALTGPLDAFEALEHLTDVQATAEAAEAARDAAEAREERAAIAEHDGGLSRENAQRVAAGLPPLPDPIQPEHVRPLPKPEIPKAAEVIPLRRRQTGT
ncbi:hypothetical protein [Tropicimonas sp. IMCC6043]|uniref:hypothetical protein n=1 Tax=Tropicimonas sp. IMCC6043 TaxID=2510645 RepID=UPI001A921682|nr:hypothetical protein [Tropicimonas sp. IMCC6043]